MNAVGVVFAAVTLAALVTVAAVLVARRLGAALDRGVRDGVERGVQNAFRSHADALLQQAAAADGDGDHERGYRLRAWARLFKDADQTKEET